MADELGASGAGGVRTRRTKTLDCGPITDGTVKFEASLTDIAESDLGGPSLDVVHDIGIRGRLSVPDFVLHDVQPISRVLPYDECAVAMLLVERVSGLCIVDGYRRAVIDLMGRTRGCSHFMTLTLELAQLQTLAMYESMRAVNPDGDRRSPGWLASAPGLVDACYSLRSGSVAIRSAGLGSNVDDGDR